MSYINCNGCNRSFSNDKSLSHPFQHNQTCKSIHYNLNLHSPLHSIYQIKTRNKVKELNDLIESKKKELALFLANIGHNLNESIQKLYYTDNQMQSSTHDDYKFGKGENDKTPNYTMTI